MIKRWWKPLLLLVVLALIGMQAYGLLAVRGSFRPFRSAADAGGDAVAAGMPGHRIVGRVYVEGTPAAAAPLVLILHGDAPFTNPRYQYVLASDLAKAVPGTRVAALMRPGYADAYGSRSDGDRGFASGDNYTAAAVRDVADAIRSLRTQWASPAVILAGHSGGATMAADIAALTPGLVQQVFLVSCPCDVPAFRRHMAALQWAPIWLLPVRSLSPMQTLQQMGQDTRITAISGADDPIALPQYARGYVAQAQARGIAASMITIPAQGHEIFNEPAVIQAIAAAVRDDGAAIPP